MIEIGTVAGVHPGITSKGVGRDIRFTFSEPTFLAIKTIQTSD